MKSSFLSALKTGSAVAALGAVLLTAPARAQDAPAKAAPAASAADVSNTEGAEIIVTGSAIKRTDYETPSPVDVLSSTDLANTGLTTTASILTDLTANGAGTLSNNNSEAFAGGAAGVALRGLSVGDTLVLVDGHRLSPYPLSDDGERQFTDVQSIPLGAIESVEVLKDGASTRYGSDAIAGVVNIKLKKQIVGLEAQVDAGTSQHGGGTYKHFEVSAGHGDLGTDGYNAFITAEYRDQGAITLADRMYEPWANLNFTRFGGQNISPGAPNVFNANLAPTQTPYLVNPANGAQTFLGNGCNPTAMAAAQCTYASPQVLLAPTRNINVLAGLTKNFEGGWQARLKLSFFDSRGQQTGLDYGAVGNQGYSVYPGASYGGNVSNPYVGLPVPGVGAVPSFGLPANYLGSGSAAGSYLEGTLAGFGLPTINIDSKTYRAALDVDGTVAGWDVTGALGFSEVVTDQSFVNYVQYANLYADLTTFNANGSPVYNPLGGNSAAVLQQIAPTFGNHATDRLLYADASATKKLATYSGGELSVAMGAEVNSKKLNNPGPGPVLSGAVGGTFSTYAIGSQTDVAEFLEVDATAFNTLEVNASVRDDWYDTYGNSLTPKAGIKWHPIAPLVLRGTFSKGFRAPAPAEFGQSATVFGLGGFQDPVLCPGGAATAKGTVPAACSEQVGFVQTTTPTLKPETSTSFTGGAVIEPMRGLSMTVDYYNIKIDNQIVSASELPSYSFSGANCLRGPDLPISGVSDGAGNLVTATPIAGPLAACLAGYVNAQTTKTSGLDIEAKFKHRLGGGTLSANAEWTHILNYQLTGPNGITYQLAGTHGPSGVSGDTANPRDRINATITYEYGGARIGLSGYWISSYSITDPSASGGAQATCGGAFNAAFAMAQAVVGPANQQLCRVNSFTSVNLVTSYKFNDNVTLAFNIDNLFDASAPIDAETYGGSFTPFNPAVAEDGVIGRYFTIQLNYKY
ncbi:MAG: TonB-dependent receptor [Sphingomonadales bacterium]|nr:TonB-dependent receptor [Sphingomonadales bacterium]